ncbi:MAG: hypothetical protein GY711_14225, partial [bacterium]|nr:hypothetical protein [bacterium]
MYIMSGVASHWDGGDEAARRGGPKVPNSSRDDVGAYAVLCGNWGGTRESRELARHIDVDLKTTPGTLLLLQEAHAGAAATLMAAPSADSGARGGGPEPQGARGGVPSQRPEFQFLVCRGQEQCNTLLVAGRRSHVAKLTELLWLRSNDGTFTANKRKVVAQSRLLICEAEFRRPQAGHTAIVVADAHMHYASAKKATGTAAGHAQWFRDLGDELLKYRVRILGGDFNMSCFVVAEKLREKGMEVALGAFTGFSKGGSAYADSVGVWILGPVASMETLHSAEDFETRTLPMRKQGQGYQLSAYLPKGEPGALESMR